MKLSNNFLIKEPTPQEREVINQILKLIPMISIGYSQINEIEAIICTRKNFHYWGKNIACLKFVFF